MRKRILVTGVAGFIGSNLADRLIAEGFSVVGIDNLSYGVKEQIPEGVDFKELDIRSKEIHPFFKDIDVVFHLAAKNCLPDCQNDPVETADINVHGTVNVFEAACRAGVRRVVYAESSAVYEERALGFYAISKTCDNLFAQGYRESFGLKTVGMRYFNVYGPRQDYRRTIPPVMSSFIIKMLTGKTPIIYEDDDENKRDFINVDDVNDFHIICINDDRVDNKVFNVGSGQNYSIAEVYNLIKDIIGANPEVDRRSRNSDDPVVSTLADISEARKLGWAPRIKLRAGLESMVEYIKKEIVEGRIK